MQEAVRDLSIRWRRARRAAANAVVGEARPDTEEAELMACATEVDAVELHRRLFEHSARLGEGFVRHHRQAVSWAELPGVLQALDSPCLTQAVWTAHPHERAWTAQRPPCRRCDASQCDAWREAIDGLVVGLTGTVRHTRTESAGHGQVRCVDVLYSDPESPLRYGELPDELVPALESVQRFVRLFKGADVRFLGVSEGVLLYQLDVSQCGELRGHAQDLVEATLAKKLPHLRLRELSPRPVLDAHASPNSTHEDPP